MHAHVTAVTLDPRDALQGHLDKFLEFVIVQQVITGQLMEAVAARQCVGLRGALAQ